MEAEHHGHAPRWRDVGERAVQRLAVADGHVARLAEHGHRVGQAIRAARRHFRGDVDLAPLVAAGHHPERVLRRRRMQLRHVVEAVDVLVPLGMPPVRRAVLMPRHRCAEARLLDPDGIRERREVRAVQALGGAQQIRVAVQAQAGIHRVQGAVDEVERPRRRIGVRRRFGHLRRMAAVVLARAAVRIRERFAEGERRNPQLLPERRPAELVHGCAGFAWRTLQQVRQFAAQILDFGALQHTFQNVEAIAPVGAGDVRVQLPALVEAQRSAIAQGKRSRLASREVRLRRFRLLFRHVPNSASVRRRALPKPWRPCAMMGA